MEINKTYMVYIQGNLNTDNYAPETVQQIINSVVGNLADLINDNLPDSLIAICKEASMEN